MKSINQKKSQVERLFLEGLEKFKSLMRATLSPKHSFNDGEFVTGEGGVSFPSILLWSLVHALSASVISFSKEYQLNMLCAHDKRCPFSQETSYKIEVSFLGWS